MDLVTSHVNADFDAVASMVAATKLYPGAVASFPGAQERSVRGFLNTAGQAFHFLRARDVDLDQVRRLIIVDTKDPSRIGRFADLANRPGVDIHIYDHHPFQPGDLRGSRERIEEVAAVSTVMVELLRKRKISLSPAEATLLALGIYEETGFFSFPATGEREFEAMRFLMRRGTNLNIVTTFLAREPDAEQMELLHELLHAAREEFVLGLRVRVAVASREQYIGDAAMLAHKLRDITEADVLFVLVRMEDRTHIIGRSRTPELDVSRVLEAYGGGGHPTAGSAVVKGSVLEDLERDVWVRIRDCIRPGKTAADLMTKPVVTVDCGTSIAEVEKLLTRYSVSVLPVLKDDSFFGIISREVVEKALHHGFARSPAEEFATTGVATAEPEAPISEVESLMIEHHQRFLPVVRKNRVIGAITRTDLLRTLYEDLIRKSRIEGEEIPSSKTLTKNLAGLVRDRFPDRIAGILKSAGETAEAQGFSVYLVGGSVRDLLRAEKNLDLDLVVEGDGIAFAREFARRLGGRIKGHERFKTAVVILPDGYKIDVATARTEFYASPGVLPEVEASSIKKDLYRRDFTINTLAIRLNPRDFGDLIDHFGGQRDLKEKTIRILHNLSFVEDPTRAFRAIRFAERFGFRISRHTANLIRAAVRMDLFGRVSGSRLWEELSLLFEETLPDRVLEALSRYDLLAVIHPALKLTEGLREFMEELRSVLDWYRLLYVESRGPSRGELLLVGLLADLPWGQKKEALTRLEPTGREAKAVLTALKLSGEGLKRLGDLDPKSIYHALEGLPVEAVLLTMARTPDDRRKKAVSSYITRYRNLRPELSGKDLKTLGYPPGPRYKEILRALLDARLDGEVETRDDEIAWVKARFSLASGIPDR